jgi:hypothetical protein
VATKAVAPYRPHKAARLVNEGKVTPLTHARSYRVDGDTPDRIYTVTLADEGSFCDCDWGLKQHEDPRDCAHVLAAKVLEMRAEDPFEGLPSEQNPKGGKR